MICKNLGNKNFCCVWNSTIFKDLGSHKLVKECFLKQQKKIDLAVTNFIIEEACVSSRFAAHDWALENLVHGAHVQAAHMTTGFAFTQPRNPPARNPPAWDPQAGDSLPQTLKGIRPLTIADFWKMLLCLPHTRPHYYLERGAEAIRAQKSDVNFDLKMLVLLIYFTSTAYFVCKKITLR